MQEHSDRRDLHIIYNSQLALLYEEVNERKSRATGWRVIIIDYTESRWWVCIRARKNHPLCSCGYRENLPPKTVNKVRFATVLRFPMLNKAVCVSSKNLQLAVAQSFSPIGWWSTLRNGAGFGAGFRPPNVPPPLPDRSPPRKGPVAQRRARWSIMIAGFWRKSWCIDE